MNPYIQIQLFNMQAAVRNGRQACHDAALKDDGRVSAEEAKLLKALDKSVERFLHDLDKLK